MGIIHKEDLFSRSLSNCAKVIEVGVDSQSKCHLYGSVAFGYLFEGERRRFLDSKFREAGNITRNAIAVLPSHKFVYWLSTGLSNDVPKCDVAGGHCVQWESREMSPFMNTPVCGDPEPVEVKGLCPR